MQKQIAGQRDMTTKQFRCRLTIERHMLQGRMLAQKTGDIVGDHAG